MAQDPQNQFYPDNSQPNYYNSQQNYDPNMAYQNGYVDLAQAQNPVYQYPIDNTQAIEQQPSQYDPAQYYQPQPAPVADLNYQYSQAVSPQPMPSDPYQAYSQTSTYPVDPMQQVGGYNNSGFEQQGFSSPVESIGDPNLNLQPQVDYSQLQGLENQNSTYNNFDPNYDPENQFDPNTPEPPHQEAGFFANKRNLVIVGLIVLMVGLISLSGILFYLRSQEVPVIPAVSQPAQTSSAAGDTTPVAPTIPKTTTTTGGTAAISSQAGRAVAIGTTDTGGAGTPATNSKKFSLSKLPIEWIKSKFSSDVLNEDGTCKAVLKCGEKADPDNDGLLNIEEYNFQTDPLSPDTDNDGISDGDETKVYYTDPTRKDSDNDTYEDGDEITNCYDPITATSNKLSTARKSQINSIVATVPIHKSTIDKLKKAGATSDDIADKGYISIKCGQAATTSTNTSEKK
jgi:Bacterial TSP3 repeat